MPNREIIEKLKLKKQELFSKYHLKSIGVFGSYARGEETPESDVDVLVEYDITPSMFELCNLEINLEKYLNRKIDLVEKYSIKKGLENYILNEVVYL